MPQGSKYLIGGYAWQYIVSNSKINRKAGSFGATDSVLVSIMPPRRRPPPTQTAAPNPSAVHSDAPSGQPVLEEERLEEERLEQTGTRARRPARPPQRYIQENGEDVEAALAPPRAAADNPNGPNRRPRGPTRPNPTQDTEFIDIDAGLALLGDDDDDDDSDEPQIPRARAPHGPAPRTLRTADSINDTIDSVQSRGRALDVHHFFEKRTKESTICLLCKYVIRSRY